MKSWLPTNASLHLATAYPNHLAQSFVVIPLLLLPFLLLTHHTGTGTSQHYVFSTDNMPAKTMGRSIVWQAELNNQRLLLRIPQSKNQGTLILQQSLQPNKEEKTGANHPYQHIHAYLLDLRQRFGNFDLLQLEVDGAAPHGLVQEITKMLQQIFPPTREYSEQNRMIVYCSTCN